MIDVRAAIYPVIGAWQRRSTLRRVERHDLGGRGAELECRRTLGEPGLYGGPVIERRLQRGRDTGHELTTREIPADDRQSPVAIAAPEGRQFHLAPFQL